MAALKGVRFEQHVLTYNARNAFFQFPEIAFEIFNSLFLLLATHPLYLKLFHSGEGKTYIVPWIPLGHHIDGAVRLCGIPICSGSLEGVPFHTHVFGFSFPL